jgi:hypothetical protein
MGFLFPMTSMHKNFQISNRCLPAWIPRDLADECGVHAAMIQFLPVPLHFQDYMLLDKTN